MMCALMFMNIYEQFGEKNERVVGDWRWSSHLKISMEGSHRCTSSYIALSTATMPFLSKSLFDHRRGIVEQLCF